MKRFLILFILMIGLVPAGAQNAQPPRPAGEPAPAAKLLENEQIRVRELRLKAGEKLPVQQFPNTFLYALTDGDLVFAPPGRTPYELTFKAGEALWLSAQEAATQNETQKDIRALLVEIKQRAPAGAVAAKGKAKGKAKPATGKAAAKSKKK